MVICEVGACMCREPEQEQVLLKEKSTIILHVATSALKEAESSVNVVYHITAWYVKVSEENIQTLPD